MTITATSTRKSYVETGCSAAEVTWNVQEADSFRRLMIEALGRDCVCEPGGHCWLLESAIKVLKPRALEDGLVSAFAAVQKDANEDGDGGRPGRVDRLRGGHGSRAGRRSCRGTSRGGEPVTAQVLADLEGSTRTTVDLEDVLAAAQAFNGAQQYADVVSVTVHPVYAGSTVTPVIAMQVGGNEAGVDSLAWLFELGDDEQHINYTRRGMFRAAASRSTPAGGRSKELEAMATASAGVRRDGEGGRCHAPLCEIERATDECRRLSGRPWMQGQQPRGPAVREGTRGGGRLRRHFRDFTAGARASAFGGVLVVLIALVRSRARAFDIASAGYPV